MFNNNVFTFDFVFDGFNGADETLVWGFPGVLDRPVAADMDQDGIDDIGLWVPRNSAQDNRPIAEWYFLISDSPFNVLPLPGSIGFLDHPFEPVPFGADIYAEFGDELVLPIVGNFDPPVVAADPTNQSTEDSGDFDQDGDVDGADFLSWQRGYGMNGEPSMSDGDGNADGSVDYDDMALWSSAFGSGNFVAADFNEDGSVDGNDLAAWGGGFGAVTLAGAAGDTNWDGRVDGADFLNWQRNYNPTTTTALSAFSEGATVASSSATLAESAPIASAAELVALSSAYGGSSPSVESAAKEAALETLDEADYVDSRQQPTSATNDASSRLMRDEAAGVNSTSREESDAWDLAFDDEQDLLLGRLL